MISFRTRGNFIDFVLIEDTSLRAEHVLLSLHNTSKAIDWSYDENPLTISFTINEAQYSNIPIATIDFDGTTLTTQAGFETNIEAMFPNLAGGGGGGGSSYLVKATATITDEQIKVWPTNWIDIIPAPGANKVIVITQVIGVCDFRGGVYSNVGDAVRFYVRSGNTFHSCKSGNCNWIMEDDTEVNYFWLTPELFQEPPSVQIFGMCDVLDGGVNQPLTIYCSKTPDTTSFTGGHADNTVKLIIYYTVNDV